MALLLLNVGSSGIKHTLLERAGESVRLEGEAALDDAASTTTADGAIERAMESLRGDIDRAGVGVEAVAHRLVHGGHAFTNAVAIDAIVRQQLASLAELAPLHTPMALAAIDRAMTVWPGTPHIAVFDTTFHASLPDHAFTYPLPAALSQNHGLRRFGFHGLSHAWSAARVTQMAGAPLARIIVAHLGNGASVTAIRDGRSIDTTMGFTPMEGLMMGTRSGSVDPGLLLHLIERGGMTAADLDRVLNRESGLVGVSGVSSDMRAVEQASESGSASASLALRVFAHRARQAIGSMAVTLGGVDALVFTGGIGEHSVAMRAAIADGLGCLGLWLDDALNQTSRPDAFITRPGTGGLIAVVEAREDLMMAREAEAVLRRANR